MMQKILYEYLSVAHLLGLIETDWHDHKKPKDFRAKIFQTFTTVKVSEWAGDVRKVKKMGVTDFVLERTCREELTNLKKSSFVSE